MTRRRRVTTVAAFALALGSLAGCAGGTAYVGVYGPPVYGPPPFGPYGAYPPYGGGVWIGRPVCCEEEQQDGDVDETTNEAATESQGEPR